MGAASDKVPSVTVLVNHVLIELHLAFLCYLVCIKIWKKVWRKTWEW